MKRYLTTCFFVFILTASFAQRTTPHGWIWGLALGYQYQTAGFLKTSGWGLFAPNDTQVIRLDAGANFTWRGRGTTVMPEVGFTYYLSDKAVWPFLKAEATPHTLTPKAGVSLFSIVDIGIGYGFDVHTRKKLGPIEGITFSIDLKMPLNFHY